MGCQSRLEMIDLKDISKGYVRGGSRVSVLEKISFQIQRGDFLALMGPSGSGKSTLLNLIGGIDRPDEGSILVNSIDITKLSESELSKWRADNIGFIFQFYNLIPVLTALENVELPLQLTNLNGEERREQALEAISQVGLNDRLTHRPGELSGGQQQRVAIARALVTKAPLIVADEPTGDLDRDAGSEILELLAETNREFGRTVVMVTHDPKAAARAKSVVHFEKGRLEVGGNSVI